MTTPSMQLFSCVVISIALCPTTGLAERNADQLQGLWFGDGRHPFSGYVLLVRDHEFVVMSPLGEFRSRFEQARAVDGVTPIDIERYDGKRQLGIYKLDGAKLYLELARPGRPRPTVASVTLEDGTQRWGATFDRRPTQDGLSVLHKNLAGDFSRERPGQVKASIKSVPVVR
ncbi:hypothetical protein KOR34_31880 [Posidoniimonas corsicana]|uniref:Uncharacterized protein n=1 Tax=Posidoniimonas corsicana TaxID=1938618 RepID=A0A5C5VK13_9BACT|nr:hypothetical protein [Posidoniimonas corsicana]TWT38219.1 hypothetical protein KOR34_31880 [Posidoniimonas corsicana]